MNSFVYYVHKNYHSPVAEVLDRALANTLTYREIFELLYQYEIAMENAFAKRTTVYETLSSQDSFDGIHSKLLIVRYGAESRFKLGKTDRLFDVWRADAARLGGGDI